jgi:hypothetical protein
MKKMRSICIFGNIGGMRFEMTWSVQNVGKTYY